VICHSHTWHDFWGLVTRLGSPLDPSHVFGRLLLVLSLALSFFAVATGYGLGEDDSTARTARRYQRGPLAIKEFRAAPGDGGAAFTATRIFSEFKYDTKGRNGRYVATLTRFRAYAAFLPNESWWRADDDPRLLDHEQGHFDIAEINARKLTLSFGKLLAGGRTVTAGGVSAAAASKSLTKKLDEVMRRIDQQVRQENTDYDRITRHGADARVQREHRRVQELTLNRSTDELQELE
jgi:hypothetical protein